MIQSHFFNGFGHKIKPILLHICDVKNKEFLRIGSIQSRGRNTVCTCSCHCNTCQLYFAPYFAWILGQKYRKRLVTHIKRTSCPLKKIPGFSWTSLLNCYHSKCDAVSSDQINADYFTNQTITYLEKLDRSNGALICFSMGLINCIGSSLKLDGRDGPKIYCKGAEIKGDLKQTTTGPFRTSNNPVQAQIELTGLKTVDRTSKLIWKNQNQAQIQPNPLGKQSHRSPSTGEQIRASRWSHRTWYFTGFFSFFFFLFFFILPFFIGNK